LRIFIDESGGFIPSERPSSRVSCVAAVVVPESDLPNLFKDFVALRSKFTASKEIKGAELTDGQVEAVLWALGRYDIVVEAAMIDAGVHTVEEIRRLRAVQGDKIVAHVTADHHPNLRKELYQLRDEWLLLSEQLVVQMYAMIAAIDSVIRNVTMYYAQRKPAELGRFDWIIDPKDIGRTRYERVWEMVISPFLQDLSMRKPMIMVKGFDYSAFERFRSRVKELPEHLRDDARDESPDESFVATDVATLMRESVTFPDSKSNPGLQIADIIANTIARAMNQKLPENVWRHIGGLTVQKEKGHHSIHPIMVTADSVEPGTIKHEFNYHGYVLEQLDKYAKPMFSRRVR